METLRRGWLLTKTALLLGCCTVAAAQGTPRFDISQVQIEGGTIFTAAELQQLVSPYTGAKRDFGDIQRAIEAIEAAYRRRGFAAIQVQTPEQELTGGTVRLRIVESTVGDVTIESPQRYFNADNLRAGLPALQEGKTPNARDLSAQIALNNENPAKQMEVVLGLGARDGTVDAKLKVVEDDPLRLSMTLDNTGTSQTGWHRLGLAVQHANLWNRDHVATVAYQTSPEKPDQVDIYSLSYRIPAYRWAGAFDFIAAKSTVSAGVTPTTAGNLSFTGGGTVLGLRYTHTLPREADTSHKLVLGWDHRDYENTCSLGSFGASGCGPAAVSVTLQPLLFSYTRMRVGPGQATELNAGLVANVPGGRHGGDAEFQAARPSPTGGAGATANYRLLRGGMTHLSIFEGDWQLRLVANAQWTDQALLPQEQLGLAGSSAVRGFLEREVARDTGLVLNLEAYTPNFGEALGFKGNLRALAFVDAASGSNNLLAGEVQPAGDLASWGLGLRYNAGKSVSAKLDVAQVATANGQQNQGNWRGHFSLVLSF